MKRFLMYAVVGAALLSSCGKGAKLNSSSSSLDSLSYAIGTYEGSAMKQKLVGAELLSDKERINEALFLAGIGDALSKDSTAPKMDQQKAMEVIQGFFKAREQKEITENAKKGSEFLAENAKKEGVKTTASGLQYKVLSEGNGKTPIASDTVLVHYTGTVIDGTKFDSSIDRGEPIKFPVTEVIKGWTEGLMLMKEGDKYMLYIPAELAYGDQQRGPVIKPSSTLIFEVELLKVIPAKPAPAKPEPKKTK